MSAGPAVLLKLLPLYAVYLAAAMSPGPAVMYVMRTSVGSRPHGLRAALGVATGTLLWLLVAALGLAAVLKSSPRATDAVRGFGGAYFLYVAWRLALSARRPDEAELSGKPRKRSLWSAYAGGVATNVTNPKTALFFTALMTFYDVPAMPGPARAAVYCGIPALSVGWYSTVSVAFSHERVTRAYLSRRRVLDGCLAALFLGLGMELLRLAAG